MPGELFNYRAVRLENARLDGDTIDARVELGFHVSVEERFRLICADGSGMDAPERGQPGHAECFARLQELLPAGQPCIISSYKGPGDKFGRWLAVVWLPGGGESLADKLIAEGLAVAKSY